MSTHFKNYGENYVLMYFLRWSGGI